MKKFLVLAVMAVMSLTLAACGSTETVAVAVENDSIPVETTTAQTGDIVVMGEYIGTVEPNQQVNVMPGIGGEVISVYFGVGDTVDAGDILFTIDTTEINNSIASLEAQLEVQNAMVSAAQTGLALVEGSAMQSQILQASGGINQAQAGIRQAEQNLEQAEIGLSQAQMAYDLAAQGLEDTTVLFEAGVVAKVNFDQAEAGYKNAVAALERAESGYLMAEIALETAQMGLEQALEGQRILLEEAPAENRQRALDGLAQAEAARNTILLNIDLAREKLDDANVRAPISGVIERRMVEPFGFANPAAPSFIISEKDSLMVSFRVPQHSYEFLSVGDEITLLSGNTEFKGEITEISASVSMGGLLSIRGRIPNPPENLLGGTSVRIFAQAQKAENTTIVPISVVHYERGNPYIFISESGVARRVPVEVGIFNDEYIQILSDIGSSQIISTWSSRLTDGAEVMHD